ncbi:MAG: hypothetical protein ACLQGP_31720 [Isosphaeraceae bacterium]
MTIEQIGEHDGPARGAHRLALHRVARIFAATTMVVAVSLSVQGCGDHDELPDVTKQAVKFEDVPENVRAAASKAIPGVKLNEAWKNLERGGKLHSYEIRGKNPSDGKTREVRVSTTGEILEME